MAISSRASAVQPAGGIVVHNRIQHFIVNGKRFVDFYREFVNRTLVVEIILNLALGKTLVRVQFGDEFIQLGDAAFFDFSGGVQYGVVIESEFLRPLVQVVQIFRLGLPFGVQRAEELFQFGGAQDIGGKFLFHFFLRIDASFAEIPGDAQNISVSDIVALTVGAVFHDHEERFRL